jgi:hypothetical protein
MKDDIHFWVATMIRGALALLAGSAVIVIPDMARTLLLLPFAVALSILCLAAYGVLDSAIIFVTSFMTASPLARTALRMQGSLGVLVGVLLFAVIYDQVRLHWFLYLIAFQALLTAGAEFLVARHAFTHSTSSWNFAAAAVAFVFFCAYGLAATLFVNGLTPREIAWLIYGYLLGLGLAQCLTAARMLYADRLQVKQPASFVGTR